MNCKKNEIKYTHNFMSGDDSLEEFHMKTIKVEIPTITTHVAPNKIVNSYNVLQGQRARSGSVSSQLSTGIRNLPFKSSVENESMVMVENYKTVKEFLDNEEILDDDSIEEKKGLVSSIMFNCPLTFHRFWILRDRYARL